MRIIARKLLRHLEYDFHSLAVPKLGLRDLKFDLPVLIENLNPTVIDVGANKGQTIRLMKECLPSCKIFSFEPNVSLHPTLKSLFDDGSVVVEGKVLGKKSGTVFFNIYENNELSSVLSLADSEGNPFKDTVLEKRQECQMTTLDVYCEDNGIAKVDLLKIDTQGFDFDVLQGAEELLGRKAVAVILVEVNFSDLYDGQCGFGEIERFLHALGYGMLGLYEIVRDNGCIRWATACFRKLNTSNA